MTGMNDQSAMAALRAFGVEAADFELISHRENRVYSVRLSANERAVLRLHRPGYHDNSALEAELDLMAHLADSGLTVPKPYPAQDGRFLVSVGTSPVMADLLGWIEGAPLGKSGQPLDKPVATLRGQFRSIGTTLARMHMAADAWPKSGSFPRPDWNIDGLAGERPVWGRYWDNPSLSEGERDLLLAARDRARSVLCDTDLDEGIIHADPVRENLLISGEEVALIDFDDCGRGYRMFDLVTVLYPNRHEPAFDELRDELLTAYAETRRVDMPTHMLPLFMYLRSASYVGWIMERPELPDREARTRRFTDSATTQAELFLGSA